ncbi:MAG: excinuclease ABC subunit UvrA [Deltaproteobacteria bacterium]|nr:excinuclease ABC subunit UvrA [Deltaproteobacteria bacterium]
MAYDSIRIRGAREHNLKDLSLEIPRGAFVVVTGLSGSGKSSLAFDTLYAEGQRRYVESLSAYARQFLEQMDKPDVDSIEGLSPAISIEQKTTSRNPRSTVGTVTEIYDYLRLLYARVGVPHCTSCGREIASQTVTQMVDRVLDLPEGTRVEVLAPVVRGRKGEHRALLTELQRTGFLRVRVDGVMRELEEEILLEKNRKHDLEVVVDRLAVKPEIRGRLAEALELSLARAEGLAAVETRPRGDEQAQRLLFSERFSCPECGVSFPEMSPRAFSFNSPHGACPECDGLGSLAAVDPARVLPDPTKTLAEGAIAPWAGRSGIFFDQMLDALKKALQLDVHVPWKDLSEGVQHAVLYGTGQKEVDFSFQMKASVYAFRKPFEGVIPRLTRQLREAKDETDLEELAPYLETRPCPACAGARLRPESRAVTVGGKPIHEVTALPIDAGAAFFDALALPAREASIAERVLKEVRERLRFLLDVGLRYLTLDRAAGTLSGGESQRIRLATQVGSRLTGVLYILDEPTIGLHPRDNRRLLATLLGLRDLGNTVLVVEHDEETIRAADHVIDMGPGAGEHGGEIVAQGTPDEVAAHPASLTGAYLSGRRSIEVPRSRRRLDGRCLTLRGARGNNLRGRDVCFPLGAFTCVTGVSGSGKSTLVVETLFPALAASLHGAHSRPLPHDGLDGLEWIDKVVDVDQSPIGRTPRSNPATYTGLFAPLRDLYARLPEAQVRGFGKGRFSFNVKGGRCEACKGDGLLKIEMHFLPDVYVTCDECGGRRYNRETLEVRYKGASIADVLEMTVSHAREFLQNVPSLREKLVTLADVGLGYVRLGQSSTTLSGGEAQRVKLSKELSRRATGRTLYILDEPTTGLHFEDVRKLLEVLHRLVDAGNTVLVIEHNLDVIKTADHVIDLGPEGGDGGGFVVAEGPPEAVAACTESHTGAALQRLLGRGEAGRPEAGSAVTGKRGRVPRPRKPPSVAASRPPTGRSP